MSILVIPDKNKCTKEEWNRYIKRLLTKQPNKSQKENYKLYNGNKI